MEPTLLGLDRRDGLFIRGSRLFLYEKRGTQRVGLLYVFLLEAVFQRDYPVVTGVFLVVGVCILLINLFVDLTYSLLDPKVRS